ncbi:nucleotidyltransferase domain-containing protein [Pyrodictium abyssi]|uniref:Polymerase beta nucleotidyltransferase domain-containing protein n=1 Tax=Pyrodictium abyssi TaxID=54256 RepID=A0ABM8J0L2_9CREN|nr:hypothetical protein PABY_19560 [Pyrodictium abyssi]
MKRLLEEKPLPRSMPPRARLETARLIASELSRHREILLALIYGGFTRHRLFRDIDVAVYTAGRISYHDEPYYTYTLSLLLSKLAGAPVDVKLLDYAPPGFRAAVLSKGQPLFTRRPGLRWSLLLRAKDELRGLQRHAQNKPRAPGPPTPSTPG